MPQPFAHALIRWQIRHTLLEQERAMLTRELCQATAPHEVARLTERLADAERQLRALGPDPSVRMN